MIEIFGVILLTALCVNGINIASEHGMILHSLKDFLLKQIGNYKIYKPIIGCVRCMPSIYGTIICFCILPFNIHLLYLIPIVVLSSSTVATIIHSLYL